jgi:hypothetical protein
VTAVTVQAENGTPIVSFLASGGVRSVGDYCTGCGCNTAYGYGSFVNRIPSEWQRDAASPVLRGYLCSDCQAMECDRCGELSADYGAAPDGSGFWCDDCREAAEVAA